MVAWGRMRSPLGFSGAATLLIGVLAAAIAGVVVGEGAEAVIHLSLGASFLQFAAAVFDFPLPGWPRIAASVAFAALAGIFLTQGLADVTGSELLRHAAYDVLGQRLEKVLGYAFLAWCAVLCAAGTRGRTRAFGAITIAVVVTVEIYSYGATALGGFAPSLLKFAYLPLFAWLLMESAKAKSEEATT